MEIKKSLVNLFTKYINDYAGEKNVVFPFSPLHDGCIEVEVKEIDDEIELSDGGETFGMLATNFGLMPEDLNDAQKSYIVQVLELYDVKMEKNQVLVKTCKKDDYQEAMMEIIIAMLQLYSINFIEDSECKQLLEYPNSHVYFEHDDVYAFSTHSAIKQILDEIPKMVNNHDRKKLFQSLLREFTFMIDKVHFGDYEHGITNIEGMMDTFINFVCQLIMYYMKEDSGFRANGVRESVFTLVYYMRDYFNKPKSKILGAKKYTAFKNQFNDLFKMGISVEEAKKAIDWEQLGMGKDGFDIIKLDDGTWNARNVEYMINLIGLTPKDLQDKIRNWKEDLYLTYHNEEEESEGDYLNDEEKEKYYKGYVLFKKLFPKSKP